ncbi:Nramp family divalent metal transporter [Streptomyces brasiliensis]|uniref:Divalent metal cation transporter MntH n=1 Tax=Streptomyces brasiliensis TaxID=1954 RepID=A0A917KB89_9ACTN|nr:Nramp family divalent metal transporter [Streptomyces brasiliensis]GGJ06990.1 divalent metal cation transporter MntH [Streptomyces brasiliensis]
MATEPTSAESGQLDPPRSSRASGRTPGERRPRLRAGLSYSLLGPAFVAAVAYVDPGNFATNVQAGATFGPLLLWVLLTANVVAMLLQYLSAKLGVATGMSLPAVCRARYRRPVVWGLWVQAEAVVVMTDLAEVVGGAIALNLLAGVPLWLGGVLVGAVSLLLMPMRGRGRRRFEVLMAAGLACLLALFLGQVLGAGAPLSESVDGLVPRLSGADSLVLAGGIVGATVMPHVIYLHSALTSDRYSLDLSPGAGGPPEDPDRPLRHRLLRHVRTDVLVAMGLAGAVNVALLVSAATLFHPGAPGAADSLAAAHDAYGRLVGPLAALAFALALLVSGLAGTSVGMYAGEVVMGGFLGRRIPVLLRRLVTMIPAIAVLAAGAGPTQSLVVSQIILSFGIPFALIPLVLVTRDRSVMGRWVNRRATTCGAWAVSVVVVALNVALLTSVFGG